MAIEISEFQLPITPQRVHDILQMNTDEFGIFLDLDRIYELQCIMYRNMNGIHKVLNQILGRPFDIKQKGTVIDIFVSMGVPSQEFGPSCNSLNKDVYQAILENEEYNEVIHTFMEGYVKYVNYRTRYNTLVSYSDKLFRSDLWSTDGHRMVVAHPQWKVLSTSRMATSDPNIQGLSRDYADIVTEPEGYNLVRCDSSQIEPRINWSYFLRDELIMNLINCYNDAYYGILAYCNLTAEEEALLRQDFSHYEKQEVSSDFKEKRQHIKRLTNAASYGSTQLKGVDTKLSSAYEKKIVKHPKRLELEERIKTQVARGDTTFYGAFGTPVIPEATQKYQPGTKGWENHLVRCGINNPVQTTASELMMISVNEATKILSKAEDSHIAFYKHDEGCFYISDADKANGILDELADITAYNVKGWLPIPADTEYGRLENTLIPSYI